MSDISDFNILVAKCGKTVGLKGSVKLIIYTDFLEIFKEKNHFRCGDRILTIESFNRFQNSVKFIEISDIDSAKMLNSLMLYTTKEMTSKYCKLNNNEFFWFDIVGLKLYDNELLLGHISDIERIANIDYLVVQTNLDLFKKPKNFLVPYISRYIIKTDLENKCIYTKDTLGILEES